MRPGTGPAVDPSGMIREISDKSRELRRRAEDLASQLAKISETVTLPDRGVTVTVGAGGIMRNLKFEHSALRDDPARVAEAVMKAYQKGCHIVGEQAADLVQAQTPRSPIPQMMRAAVPPDPTVDDEGGSSR
jgi:hypothetical protein